jgi:hypothetical protein
VVEKVTNHQPGELSGWQQGPGSHDAIPKGRYGGKWSDTDPQSSGQRILANVKAARDAGGYHDNPFPPKVTTHWLPTCKCPAHEPVPCVVLDPFGGAATTALAAHELGRRCVIVERKAEYLDIGRRRLANHRPRTAKRAKKPRAAKPEPLLFGEVA